MTPCDDDDEPPSDEILKQFCLEQAELKTREILDRLKKEGATASQIEAQLPKLKRIMASYTARLYHINKMVRDADLSSSSVN